MTYKVSQTTPATAWVLITPGEMPYTFENNRYPKAVLMNTAGTVQLVDRTGNSVTFSLAEGVPIPLRPTSIQSATQDVVALFD